MHYCICVNTIVIIIFLFVYLVAASVLFNILLFIFAVGTLTTCHGSVPNLYLSKKTRKAVLQSEIHQQKVFTPYRYTQKCKLDDFFEFLQKKYICMQLIFRPHPHVKHYHIKQNSRGEFFLSEKHCCNSIPDLINYHKYNSGGLASRLKSSPCDRPVPATAGLSHGEFLVEIVFNCNLE